MLHRFAASVIVGFVLAGAIWTEASATTMPPGDANLDGVVDRLDARILAMNWLHRNVTGGAQAGDFNGDGCVDDLDAAILAANWCYVPPDPEPTLNPEPASLLIWALVGLCAVGGVWWRSRRRPG